MNVRCKDCGREITDKRIELAAQRKFGFYQEKRKKISKMKNTIMFNEISMGFIYAFWIFVAFMWMAIISVPYLIFIFVVWSAKMSIAEFQVGTLIGSIMSYAIISYVFIQVCMKQAVKYCIPLKVQNARYAYELNQRGKNESKK